MKLKIVFLVTTCLAVGVYGVLRMPKYYSNHMVLQRAPARAILWGYADVIGDTVIVLRNGVKVEETTVQKSGSNGSIDWFSALCSMFAPDLQKHLNYPIGIIESNWGGAPIEVWSSPDAINACPTTAKPSPSIHYPTDPGALWNSMIHPYLSMTIKGAIWYQGEAFSGHPDLYACQFPAMINDWRKKFHANSDGETSDHFPFGFVQLAPYRAGNTIGGFPPTRWAQTTDVGYVPNINMPDTFMAVAIDLLDFNSPS
ncbi:sialate O-acetylesterase-like [Mercenaria mercenaria]|uniref:sialate O-acetylesterase-like n=1 Tax=Mercenaria mercenaria TaxID=6596 RepID=UPI00234F745D|nr:sialate O-acetylesterase-like [Mercenaria mercenaria]